MSCSYLSSALLVTTTFWQFSRPKSVCRVLFLIRALDVKVWNHVKRTLPETAFEMTYCSCCRKLHIGLGCQITLKLQHDSHSSCSGSNPVMMLLLGSQERLGLVLPAPCNCWMICLHWGHFFCKIVNYKAVFIQKLEAMVEDVYLIAWLYLESRISP